MSHTITAPAPAALPDHPSEALPVPSDASRPEPWDTPTLSGGGFLKVGSVVPWSAPVLQFAPDGTPSGLVSQEDADWVTDTLDALDIVYTPAPWPGPRSTACLTQWDAGNGLHWQCSLPKGHAEAIQCEAQALKGAVLAARGQERADTTALKPTVRKRAPKAVA